MNLIKKLLVAQAAAVIMWAGAVQASSDEEIAARLKPVGEVCVQGTECEAAASAPAAAAPAAASARSAEEIVNKACNACHLAGVAGAPLLGDTADWTARSNAEGGLDGLLAVAKAGKGAMPPMGLCADCSDEELMSAIKSMSGL